MVATRQPFKRCIYFCETLNSRFVFYFFFFFYQRKRNDYSFLNNFKIQMCVFSPFVFVIYKQPKTNRRKWARKRTADSLLLLHSYTYLVFFFLFSDRIISLDTKMFIRVLYGMRTVVICLAGSGCLEFNVYVRMQFMTIDVAKTNKVVIPMWSDAGR